MPKAKKKTQADEAPETTPMETSSPSDVEEKDGKKKRLGYFIPLTDDGLIDTARLRGDTGRLEAVRAALNAGAGEPVKPAFELNPEFAGYLYDGVSKVIQLIGVQFLKWPADFAVLMTYSQESKEKLGPPTVSVLQRLGPMWLAKNQDLAALGILLATETQSMIQRAGMIYAQAHPELLQPPKPAQPTNGRDVSAQPATRQI